MDVQAVAPYSLTISPADFPVRVVHVEGVHRFELGVDSRMVPSHASDTDDTNVHLLHLVDSPGNGREIVFRYEGVDGDGEDRGGEPARTGQGSFPCIPRSSG